VPDRGLHPQPYASGREYWTLAKLAWYLPNGLMCFCIEVAPEPCGFLNGAVSDCVIVFAHAVHCLFTASAPP
jgi:hypothetical protein